MNGKLAKRLRRQSWSICAKEIARSGFQERTAPTMTTNLPAAALLKWTASGQMMCPAETGRYWYQRMKRVYRAYRLSGIAGADMVRDCYSDLAYRLRARLTFKAGA
jgi:ribosomal protein S19E (S16A)